MNKYKTVEINDIEKLLDMSIHEVKSAYDDWDNSDCSLVGIAEILVMQSILLHKKQNGAYYDTDFDNIKLRY